MTAARLIWFAFRNIFVDFGQTIRIFALPALMLALIGALDQRAPLPLVMIGDAEYYGRFFGFTAAPTQQWQVPGPVDHKRLLVRCDNPAVLPREGALGPWRG